MAQTAYNGQMVVSDYAPSTADLAMNKPLLYEAIVRQHSTQYRDTIGMDFRKAGVEYPMDSDTGTIFLEGWTHENFVVAAGGVGASVPGGTQVIPIDATSMNSGRTYVKVGHVIVYPTATNQTAVVESIDLAVPTVTVRADAGDTLPLLAGGETIAIVSSAWGEGTTQPEPSKKEYEQIHYWTQILKDEVGITGSQLTNKAWVDISEYGTAYKFFNVAIADMDHRMDILEENAYLLGSGGTATPTAGSAIGTSVRQMKGLITWGKERGANVDVDPATVDITDLRAIRTYYQAQGDQSNDIYGWVGANLGNGLSDELWSQVQSAGADPIVSALTLRMGQNNIDTSDATARAITMNYRQFNDFEGSFVFKKITAFSDPKVLGSTGYTYNNKSLWFPWCNIKDGNSGVVYPNVSVRYKSMDGYSRRRELVELTGATNGMHTTQFDYNLAGHKAELSLQVMNPSLIYMTYHD